MVGAGQPLFRPQHATAAMAQTCTRHTLLVLVRQKDPVPLLLILLEAVVVADNPAHLGVHHVALFAPYHHVHLLTQDLGEARCGLERGEGLRAGGGLGLGGAGRESG